MTIYGCFKVVLKRQDELTCGLLHQLFSEAVQTLLTALRDFFAAQVTLITFRILHLKISYFATMLSATKQTRFPLNGMISDIVIDTHACTCTEINARLN